MPAIETLTARFRPHAGTEARDVLASVSIRSDDYHFTVTDGQGRPIGSIHRPRRDGKDGQAGKWAAYRTDGRTVCTTAPGPRIALTRIARQRIDESGLVGTIALESDAPAPAAEEAAPAAPAPVATVRTIDATPTWAGILPMLLAAYENGTPEGRRIAIEELNRMAAIADSAVAASKAL